MEKGVTIKNTFKMKNIIEYMLLRQEGRFYSYPDIFKGTFVGNIIKQQEC